MRYGRFGRRCRCQWTDFWFRLRHSRRLKCKNICLYCEVHWWKKKNFPVNVVVKTLFQSFSFGVSVILGCDLARLVFDVKTIKASVSVRKLDKFFWISLFVNTLVAAIITSLGVGMGQPYSSQTCGNYVCLYQNPYAQSYVIFLPFLIAKSINIITAILIVVKFHQVRSNLRKLEVKGVAFGGLYNENFLSEQLIVHLEIKKNQFSLAYFFYLA